MTIETVGLGILVVNAWTMIRFFIDKLRAESGGWRVPESELLGLALIGGTPAAYAARHLARNVVAAGLASRCTIQLAYAIGVSDPLSIYVDTHGTGEADPVRIEAAIRDSVDLTPRGIRTRLGLNRPIYRRTAAYGHFGREPQSDGGFSWERDDLVEALKAAV